MVATAHLSQVPTPRELCPRRSYQHHQNLSCNPYNNALRKVEFTDEITEV